MSLEIETETEAGLNRICLSLEAENKERRKRVLNEILKAIFEKEEILDTDNLLKIWDKLNRPLIKLLNDQAEVCRDRAVELLKNFLNLLTPHDKHIIYVIPVLSRRLSPEEYIEPSEEVRLKCITLLKVIILKYKDHISIYMDEIIGILARTVRDKYPNAKRESCECISELAKIVPRHFYTYSETLIKPILSNFSHQHYRVRVASVKTIGDAIQYGNSKSMEEVATPLAERLFDQSGVVRAAVVEVAGHWLVELRDRYSWWHKILPLILTGLHDEIETIRVSAAKMWDEAGQLYIKENQSDEKFKDKMDFLIEKPKHYPPNITRPNLGCRTIVQENLCKLVNGITRELDDWMADIRLRSAQLLSVLILNAEEYVTQHIEKLLPAIYRACNDEDKRVVDNIEIAAEYLGYFVPPQIYCRLVLPTLENSPTAGHLKAFSAIIRCTETNILLPHIEKISNFLQQSYISRSKKSIYQQQLLSCCDSLLTVCNKECVLISQNLFTVIFTCLAMSTEKFISKEADRLFDVLASIESLENTEDLFLHHIKAMLMSICDNCDSWTTYSPEHQIFRTCLIRTSIAAATHMDIVLPMLQDIMSKNTDMELRLLYLILLSEYLLCNKQSLRCIIDFPKFVNEILEICIIPNLIWSAGRISEALRTASISCLCALLQNDIHSTHVKDSITIVNEEIDNKANECKITIFSTVENYLSVFDRIIPILITLVDDNMKKTRLYSLRAIYYMMSIGHKLSCVKEDHIHRVCTSVLKRLDDGSDEIRWAALEALVEIWFTIPKDYNIICCKSYIDCLYTTVLIHLDDPEPKFQEFVLDVLIHLAKIYPELLFEKLKNCQTNFRNQTGIEILLNHCQAMSDATTDHVDVVEDELEVESNYKPPPEKTIEQILEADKEDESLRKYKETLLGEAKAGGVIVDPNDPRKVIVKKLALCVADRPDMELDLSGDLSQLKKQTFVIKEGVSYRIRIDFIVQREIVHGLKYVQKTYRLGVPVDKMAHMVGSYPPKTEVQSYTTPAEDAPAGVMARGSYSVSSLFTDDDKHEHLKWEWSFEIKKDWKE
ncbi:PREDICTED: dynein assembly factor 5, axonemal isoform X2 [Polistes dominula]|uniref:Dynein assembly factor 5, axonemal isoform X2 n=2 Tax=Polistes TaxID=7456 RepID=A0ABM1J8S9_POLDO|nr:PREDICTED: dynein assembly factor 5, axonemal isoform X2 [Polistes dominula]